MNIHDKRITVAPTSAPRQLRSAQAQEALSLLNAELENLEHKVDQLYGIPSQAPDGPKAPTMSVVDLLNSLPDILNSCSSRINNASRRLEEGLI